MIADRLRTSWGEILKTVKTVFLSADDRRRQKAEISSQHALSVVISRTEHNVPGLRHSHNESYHFIPLPIHHTLSLVTTLIPYKWRVFTLHLFRLFEMLNVQWSLQVTLTDSTG